MGRDGVCEGVESLHFMCNPFFSIELSITRPKFTDAEFANAFIF